MKLLRVLFAAAAAKGTLGDEGGGATDRPKFWPSDEPWPAKDGPVVGCVGSPGFAKIYVLRSGRAVRGEFLSDPLPDYFYDGHHAAEIDAIDVKLIAILVDFYARANPDKIESIQFIAVSYAGREELLFKSMEELYPGYAVHREGPPFPESDRDTTLEDMFPDYECDAAPAMPKPKPKPTEVFADDDYYYYDAFAYDDWQTTTTVYGLAKVVSMSGADRNLYIEGQGLCEPTGAWRSSAVKLEFDPPLEAGIDYDIWELSASQIKLKRRPEKKWRLEPGYLLLKSLQCPGGPKVTFRDGEGNGIVVASVHADPKCDDSCEFALNDVCDDASVPAGCGKRGGGHGRIRHGMWEPCPGDIELSGDDYYDSPGYSDDYGGGDDDDDDFPSGDFPSDDYEETAPVCDLGTDCTDCKVLHGFWWEQPGVDCENTCASAGDGVCDDPRGTSKCDLGTDCQDCGPRFAARDPRPAEGLVMDGDEDTWQEEDDGVYFKRNLAKKMLSEIEGGPWVATSWWGAATKGGDPDPYGNERVIKINDGIVYWVNGGGGGPYDLKPTLETEHPLRVASPDGEPITFSNLNSYESDWKSDSGGVTTMVLIVDFSYESPAQIFYEKQEWADVTIEEAGEDKPNYVSVDDATMVAHALDEAARARGLACLLAVAALCVGVLVGCKQDRRAQTAPVIITYPKHVPAEPAGVTVVDAEAKPSAH